MAGDFTGDGQLDLAVANVTAATRRCRCCWATATARSSPQVTYAVGDRARRHRGGRLHRRRPARPGRRQLQSPTTSRCCWATATARSSTPASSPPPLMPRPWWPTSTATAPTMSWSSTAPGDILYRQGIPGQPGSFQPARHGQPRITPRATSPGCRTPIKARVLASVDAQDNAISLYAYRDGGFVRRSDRSPPASSRRRSSRPTSTATA